jgi:ribulose-phosphate 3-epimerase
MSISKIHDKLKSGFPQLSVGTLTGDMMNQAGDLEILKNAGVQFLHLDVMDGQVWPKITVGAGFLKGLKTELVKDVHLLVDKPENHIADFVAAGAGMITFQVEHTENVNETLSKIGQAGVLRGVGIYPTTDFSLVLDRLDEIDAVTVLAIGPDTGSATYFDIVTERVAKLKQLKPELIVSIDGGVKKHNMGELAKMGSDLIVTGSAAFDGNDASQNLAEMQQSIAEAIA